VFALVVARAVEHLFWSAVRTFVRTTPSGRCAPGHDTLPFAGDGPRKWIRLRIWDPAVTIVVVVRTTDPHRQSEALRAALGLTLRGARIDVVVGEPLLTPLAERAAATLRSFGHAIHQDLPAALARATAVEVWT
jgi:hypothetical protein